MFFTLSSRIWSRQGVRTPWNFGKFEFRKKIQVFFVVAIFIVTTVWLQGDYRAKYGKMNLSNFQESLTPFLTVSLISTKINSFVHWYFSKTMWILLKTTAEKSIFPPRNHYFGVFHIDHHTMHYNITKKHTMLLHVKNIDVKNYATNVATAVVLLLQRVAANVDVWNNKLRVPLILSPADPAQQLQPLLIWL